MNPMLNIAIRAIRIGGKIITQNYDSKDIRNQLDSLNTIDYLRKIRKKTFSSIYSIIHQSYPQHSIHNVYSRKKSLKKNNQWFINPLNGTMNFIKKIPHFCLSILIKEKNQTYISVIYDPIKNDLFTAIKGQGAQLNGFRARCCTYKNTSNKIIAFYFREDSQKNADLYISLIQQLIQETISFRHTGCSILDLAYLSSGKINIYVGFNEKPLNINFGELQIRESGALMTDFVGGHNYIKNKVVLIGQANILRFFLKKTRKLYKKFNF
ncbi:Inositol-1-monophosphatase [Buchnera aphidicola (Cinara pseudotaxifoliae)]|uniref:Inositol-1-monophosphatase n=1 Tax=Buchnera aphidicola (Cinara pseudotaxifoliae) TaxID=655384 RepID=A0A451DGY6_9GAMM|nr:inositol monophosphatase family protein [Buchnera aphidicola]VFP85886.1 Inositol-1-monophosphatase [Buchnera aphidicola (Cinara pseudotaxifoliae)]